MSSAPRSFFPPVPRGPRRSHLRERGLESLNAWACLFWVAGGLLSVCTLAQARTGSDSRAVGAYGTADSTLNELHDVSLEELLQLKVSTLSRVAEPADEAPGGVYVFTRSIIQQRGYRSLGELLQAVPGFTVFHKDLQFVAGVRGFNANDNDKMSLLINGHRILGMHEQEFLNGPINLDTVERVEVVVGPSSLFQQADTLAATVNVITRRVVGVDTTVSSGNYQPYAASLSAGHYWTPDHYLGFSFTLERKDGFAAWNTPGNSRVALANQKLTGELMPSVFMVADGQYGDLSGQIVVYRAESPELNIDQASSFNDGRLLEENYSFNVTHEHLWTADLTSVVRLGAAHKAQTRANIDGPVVAPTIGTVEQWLQQEVYEAEVGLRFTGWRNQLVQAGVQVSYDDNHDDAYTFQRDAVPVNISRTPLFQRDTQAVGVYCDDTIELGEKLKVIGGLRADTNSRLPGGQVYPGGRAALIARVTEHWTSKLIYNRSVRMPSALSALNQEWGTGHPTSASTPFFANFSPNVHAPETLSTVEWQNVIYIGHTRLAATLYHQELEEFITWFSPHSNGGNLRGNGVELDVSTPLSTTVTLWANAAANDSKLDLFNSSQFGPGGIKNYAVINPEHDIIGSARLTANLGFDCQLTPQLSFSPSIRYITDQAAVEQLPGAPGVNHYLTVRNRAYLDAGLLWKMSRTVAGAELQWRLSARNILDNQQPIATQFGNNLFAPQGISWVLSLDARF